MKKTILILILILALCVSFCSSAFAGVMIVSSTSVYDDSEAMYANLDKAIASLDGTVIAKGQPFSFNEIVGGRTAENGYAYAPNGNGVPVMGGGVSQIATTLHLALKSLGQEIVYDELHHFGRHYTANYTETREDAVLTDYSRNLDYRFTSNHAENLAISMWRSGDVVYCQLTGSDMTVPKQTAEPVPEAAQTPTPDQEKPELFYVVNVNSYVNLRERPSTDSASLARIPKDAVVECAGECEGDFQYVRYAGQEGYVHTDYLSESNPNAKTMQVVNCKVSVTLRETPSRQGNALADVPLGAEVEYMGISEGDFYKVFYQNMSGYVLKSYLTEIM